MVLEDNRKETPFETRDHMLDIWDHITELSFRGFGKTKRKPPKEPKNFKIWSEASKEKWYKDVETKLQRAEKWDMGFIERETKVLDDMCRRIVDLIDQANTLNPQYLFECDSQRLMQDEAIGLCNNLKRELNHIARTIPSNKNFLAIQTEDIEKEISLLRGWRKSGNAIRTDVLKKEIERRKTIAEKMGFILGTEDIENGLDDLIKKSESVTI